MIILLRLFFSLLALLSATLPLKAQSLQMGVSVDSVPVGSDFSGTSIVVFGTIEGAQQAALYRGEYDVVVEITGPLENLMVRKKDRVAGIWINTLAKEYKSVPSYYAVLSRNPLEAIADPLTLRELNLGIEHLKAIPKAQGDLAFVLNESEFNSALRRSRRRDGLFYQREDALTQLSPTLYRAELYLPPNVPIGEHVAHAYLFHDGQMLAQIEKSFRVEKVGFERWIYEFAHERSFLYGIMAVLLAIFTGWAANVIFRKK